MTYQDRIGGAPKDQEGPSMGQPFQRLLSSPMDVVSVQQSTVAKKQRCHSYRYL